MTEDEFAAVAEWAVEREMWPQRRPEVIAELEGHHRDGKRVILTSGGYTPVVERFAARMGFGEVIATPLEVVDGRITGRVAGPSNTGARKAESLRAALDGNALDAAYGDTLLDGTMLELAATPVAVYPDTGLARMARQRGWRILSGPGD